MKAEEPNKNETPAFDLPEFNAVFQVGETEEAVVKRIAIRVTNPGIYLHALLCLMHTCAIAGSFNGTDGTPFARQVELLECYGLAEILHGEHRMQ